MDLNRLVPHCRRLMIVCSITLMLILLALNKTEAMSSSGSLELKQASEKQTIAKQLSSQQQQRSHNHSRARPSSKQNRSSPVRLSSKPASSDPFRESWANYRNEPPVFVPLTRDFLVDVAKSYPGKRVTRILAHDGDNDTLEFQLKQAAFRDASLYFTINSTSGELKLSAKPFKYRLLSDRGNVDQEDEESDGDIKESIDKERSLNRYFLNVAVSDGQSTHVNTAEFNIQVTNSTLMKLRELEEADVELPADNLQKLTSEKSRKFYAELQQVLAQQQQQQQSSNNSSIVVYPDFVNPGLNVEETTEAPPSADLTSTNDETSTPGVTPTNMIMTSALSSPSSSPPPFAGLRQSITEQQSHQSATAHEPMMMNLIMIMCSCLTIALVLLIFIIPLSVKKLRKRLKHVELQHEQLSQKTSNVSSTFGSSLTGTGHHHHHHPSLSQFTLGSDVSGSCTRRESSSVFRQSSLDSANTGATLSPSHHQFNRVDNGSIANPIYLHHHQQQSQPASMHEPFKHQSFEQAGVMFQQQQQLHQMCSLQAPNVSANENVYYPLSDEFYSTIQTETTPLGDDGLRGGSNNFGNDKVQHIQGFTTNVSNYVMAQCAQPDMTELDSRPLDSPDSQASSPTLRSLTRFLSLPPQHHSAETKVSNEVNSSTIRQLEMQLGCGPFSTLGPANQAQQQQSHQQFNARTIARTCNVEREQPISGSWELERHRLRIPWVLLDEGQFGQVWRCKLSSGTARQPDRLVAVKSLKKNAANGERGREELLAEIEIMKLVCNHPNVVKLLHCCTIDDSKPILLVMEYMEQGKLQSYLEKSRLNHHYGTSPFTAAPDDNIISNSSPHQNHATTVTSSDYLTSRDLMKFIYHVAKGMEYISSKCIVHRDLASRNILVSGQKICKIGDFGMARHMQSIADVYERHSGNCKIPVRWMAPEVLLSNSFTTKSDVFSFGILMWEIITLGSTPYTHLKTEQVIDRVARNGERPERPEYCHSQLYNIMSQCWQPEPVARPSFKSLVDTLGELVLSANNYIKLDQYPDHDYYNIPKTAAPDELL